MEAERTFIWEKDACSHMSKNGVILNVSGSFGFFWLIIGSFVL
jgi:hypothetical protein